ncbi:MAG: hypothetical protein ACPG5B_13730 [Chitinophagales bacterium]
MKQLISLVFVIAILSYIPQQANAQEPNGFGINHEFGAAVAFGGGFLASANWTHFYGIGKNKNLRVGYGLRFNNYSGKDRLYTSAPLKLATDETLTDTLTVGSASMSSIAATFNIKMRFARKVELGFNIDVLGVGFGGETKGEFVSSENPEFNGTQSAKPTPISLLLGGASDRGTLSSEMYIGYWITEKFNARVGFNYLFTEYKTTEKLAQDNSRFRNRAGMPFIAISFSPYHN